MNSETACIVLHRDGQTFPTEGHIENFIAVGGPHMYFVCLNYNFQGTKI